MYLTLSSVVLAITAQASAPEPIVDAEIELVISSPVPTDFKPNDQAVTQATASFDNFWNLRDSGDFPAAYAMLTEQNRAHLKERDWIAQQVRSLQKIGADVSRQVVRVTWYPKPTEANAEIVFTALDFAARTKAGAFRCGYVVLFDDAINPVQVMSVDSTEIPMELMDGKVPRPDILSQLPCYLGSSYKTAFGKGTK